MKKNNIIIFIAFIVLISLIIILIVNNKDNNNKITNTNTGLKKLTFNEAKEKIENKEDFVLILSANGCSHCANYKPNALIVAEKYNINIYYLDIDVDNEDKNNILDYFNFDGATPTTIFLKEGKEVSIMERLVGETSRQNLINKLIKLKYIEAE